MQSKVIGCIVGLIWTGVCYEAGRVSQTVKNENFASQKVEIEHPKPKGAVIPSQVYQQTTPLTQNPFTNGLILPPYRAISYPNFKILYSTMHKCPLSVYQHVTKQIADGDAPRRATFFNQPSIQPEFQSTNDHFIKTGAYKNFNLARGHMAAAGNYSGNKEAKFQTFTYANVVPQNQHNNAGIWNTFERYSRDLVMSGKCDSVDIVSGPIYSKTQPYVQKQTNLPVNKVFKQQSLVLYDDGIVVPQKLYKIIQCNTKQDNKSYIDGFQFFNKKTFDNQKPLIEFQTTIGEIQKKTGLKFGFGYKDQLTGKLKLPDSLVEFDKEGFMKTKKAYDEKFYSKLMSYSTSINEMNGAFFRAKEQHIFVPLEQFSTKTEQLFKKQINQVEQIYNKNKQRSACQMLSRLIKLNKDLFYLKQLKPQYEQEIKRIEDKGMFDACYQKANMLRAKSWEDLQLQEDRGDTQEKKQKIALNSLTHAVTKQQQKRHQLRQSPQADNRVLLFVNLQKLQQFITPVNIEISLQQSRKQ